MATQGIQYIVTLNDPSVVSAFGRMESSALSFERSIAGINGTLSSLGIAMGIREMYDLGKSVVETGANFEQLRFMMKIASSGTADYIANLKEAKHVVEDFKLPIEETYKSWGKLLAAVKGTDMEGAPIRSMFEDLSKVFAVMPISSAEKGRAFYAIREMFEEQVVQTRHFVRQLAITIPGILPMAEHLTGTTGAQFRKMLSEKDPDKQINPKQFLPELFKGLSEQYATHANMSEQMGNIAPNITDITNAWKELEDEITVKLKPELMELFGLFKDGIGWLKANEDSLVSYGKVLFDVVKIWAEYKIVMGAIGLLRGAVGAVFGTATAGLTTQTAAAAGLNAELVMMNINLETLIALQAEMAIGGAAFGIGMSGAAGILSARAANGAFGLPINTPTSGIGGISAGIGGAIVSGAMAVGISWIGLEAMESITNAMTGRIGDEGYKFKWTGMFTDPEGESSKRAGKSEGNHLVLQGLIDKYYTSTGTRLPDTSNNLFNLIQLQQKAIEKTGEKDFDVVKSLVGINKYGDLNAHTNADLYDKMKGLGYKLPLLASSVAKSGAGGDGSTGGNRVPAKDHVTGQRVVTYNVTIGKIIGQNVDRQTIESAADFDINKIMQEVALGLQSVLNDSQLHGND